MIKKVWVFKCNQHKQIIFTWSSLEAAGKLEQCEPWLQCAGKGRSAVCTSDVTPIYPWYHRELSICPSGCLATAGALLYGLRAFHLGKNKQSQLLMRGRIAAQGFTVVAIIFGIFASSLKPKQWRHTSATRQSSWTEFTTALFGQGPVETDLSDVFNWISFFFFFLSAFIVDFEGEKCKV